MKLSLPLSSGLLLVLVAISSVQSSLFHKSHHPSTILRRQVNPTEQQNGNPKTNILDTKFADKNNNKQPNEKDNLRGISSTENPNNRILGVNTAKTSAGVKQKANIVDDDDKLVSRCQIGTAQSRVTKINYHMIMEIDEDDDSATFLRKEQLHATSKADASMKAVVGLQAAKSRKAGQAALLVAKAQDGTGVCSSRTPPPELQSKSTDNYVTQPSKTKRDTPNNGLSNDGKTKSNGVSYAGANNPLTSGTNPKHKGNVCFDVAKKTVAGGYKIKKVSHLWDASASKNGAQVHVQLVKTHNTGQWWQTMTYPDGSVERTRFKMDEELKFFTASQYCKTCEPGEKYHRVRFVDVKVALEADDLDFANSLNCTGSAAGSRIVKIDGRAQDREKFDATRTTAAGVAMSPDGKDLAWYHLDHVQLGGSVNRDTTVTVTPVRGSIGGSSTGKAVDPKKLGNQDLNDPSNPKGQDPIDPLKPKKKNPTGTSNDDFFPSNKEPVDPNNKPKGKGDEVNPGGNTFTDPN